MDGMWFKPLMDMLPVGVVIMSEQRVIYYLNHKASEMTDWQAGETLPHCLYCQARELAGEDEQCILAMDDPLPIFQTKLPVRQGNYQVFDVRTAKTKLADGHTYMIMLFYQPISTTEAEQLKVEQLLVRETMRAQEVERKRIAMELHDHIAQSVYSIFLGVQGIKNHLADDKYETHLQKMEQSLEHTMNDIKHLSKELRPQALDSLGIQKALEIAVEEWKETYRIDFELICENFNKELLQDTQLQIFRVVQEAVHNAVRHGRAKLIKIHLFSYDQRFYFHVIDNGSGFDPRTLRNTGLGLFHMKERMSMVQGDVKWHSQMGGPTTIEGYVPLYLEVSV